MGDEESGEEESDDGKKWSCKLWTGLCRRPEETEVGDEEEDEGKLPSETGEEDSEW